ncbi:capsular polysaccharide biosynthesis protein [uncultured Microbulbifer sp.]|uniref:capsular polysaccharide biosynthesis protein n=1 Tax=uncultured Microbulbifer sp. TaxID=348147 RepID=UPI0026263DF8|nr:capsular polysaccharide biosynthesis protein [uncultured Microbulbifer sp.]
MRFLESFIGGKCQYVAARPGKAVGKMVGWGLKATAVKAQRIAYRAGLPYFSIEDGFLRSVGLGVEGAQTHSLAVDYSGIYYDASRPSDLETLIRERDFSAEELSRAVSGLNLLRTHRLCKYNNSDDNPLDIPGNPPAVLVVDQTYGDISVSAGLASERHFHEMLQSAIEENPQAEIYVKIHPDVVAGKKSGYLKSLAEKNGCRVIATDLSPWSIFDCVDKVYVVTSQLGFDALIAGKEVHCFGVPFYSGWGLTKDRQSIVRRNVSRTLTEIFCAAYLRYCRYINPYTGRQCAFEDTLALIIEQKRQRQRFQGFWLGIGFSPWKRSFIPYFVGDKAKIDFSKSGKKISAVNSGTNILIWASRITKTLIDKCEESQIKLWRIEDGFLRSVGLGADLVAPSSLVLDAQGIYFDARHPNDLEVLLGTTNFSPDILFKAKKLRELLVVNRVTKYNIGGSGRPMDLCFPQNKTKILIPGQVESDASIAYGSPVIKSNFSLLQRVRAKYPNAHIIYKPHPDVVTGARTGALPVGAESQYDTIIEQGDISLLLDKVDEVHTLSSLCGFEALLRGIKVVTYGLPFYAGWGLSEDTLLVDREFHNLDLQAFKFRRQRTLSLDQLIAGALLLYPVYVDPSSGEFIDAETTVELLQMDRKVNRNRGVLFKAYRWYRNVFLKY